jgi:hypothetical protein
MTLATVPALVYDGFLQADGTIQLDRTPEIGPGRVQVTLRPLLESATRDILLPDPPWEDESIPAPCDLPLLGPRERVVLREVVGWLPDPRTEMEVEDR